jgi:hypothetical protein
MSSKNRAHTRAIRAAMAETGTNYTRAANAAARPARHLRAVCMSCRKDIPAGGGVVHIAHAEVHRIEKANAAAREARLARVVAEGRTGIEAEIVSVEELIEEHQEARWQVHCDACNPHRFNGSLCDGCYWFAVERCVTWAQLVHWTAHLLEKDWVAATNWLDFIRITAERTSDVGLVCHPADRYLDA